MTATLAAVAEALAVLGERSLMGPCNGVTYFKELRWAFYCEDGKAGPADDLRECATCNGTSLVPRTDVDSLEIVAALARQGWHVTISTEEIVVWHPAPYREAREDIHIPTDAASIREALLAAAYAAIRGATEHREESKCRTV